ncbi:MAG: hypothetical protein F4X82_02255 [Candidatus Spechtbacteria bacterium SB0662_bin_43]|uniref:Uncharacterized protein n=1 Tax=Candidatus Spechtbacteria bacterium SB0662_bin_43 TaxID=2604897 RepID=A0A845DA37_9BACT|nr:hypothetical protein [Candidatus Spechtbacteria bacterium SB0662_bin_43]
MKYRELNKMINGIKVKEKKIKSLRAFGLVQAEMDASLYKLIHEFSISTEEIVLPEEIQEYMENLLESGDQLLLVCNDTHHYCVAEEINSADEIPQEIYDTFRRWVNGEE